MKFIFINAFWFTYSILKIYHYCLRYRKIKYKTLSISINWIQKLRQSWNVEPVFSSQFDSIVQIVTSLLNLYLQSNRILPFWFSSHKLYLNMIIVSEKCQWSIYSNKWLDIKFSNFIFNYQLTTLLKCIVLRQNIVYNNLSLVTHIHSHSHYCLDI